MELWPFNLFSWSQEDNRIINLNIGGIHYTTTRGTLSRYGNKLVSLLRDDSKDIDGRYFIDRDGQSFDYILYFLRNAHCLIPDDKCMQERVLREARFYELSELANVIAVGMNTNSTCLELTDSSDSMINSTTMQTRGYIAINCKANVVFGREPQSELRFRRVSRINVCGRINLLREVFGESLNESRDPDHGNSSRYTSRFFLKHNYLEQAFDQLSFAGFKLVGSSTALCSYETATTVCKQGDLDDGKCFQFSEFIFSRY
ncbi:hypothetical protein ACOME3_008347 [Neoechinorhynchus agilis]